VLALVALVFFAQRSAQAQRRRRGDTRVVALLPVDAASPGREWQSIEAKYRGGCSQCHRAIIPGEQIWWLRGAPVRHYDCKAAQAYAESEVVAKALDKIERARSNASRAKALHDALRQVTGTLARRHLMVESSRIGLHAILDKVDGFKSEATKRRHLEKALEDLKNDNVPDELQGEQIAYLEDLLKAMDLEAMEGEERQGE
jgi:hypothetical protein